VVYPWVEAVRLCKKYGVLSMVDGAHSIGQHKVDVKASDCDFFVTVSRDLVLVVDRAILMCSA
jgi:selenocysteine lyase/cysteine desulfurase